MGVLEQVSEELKEAMRAKDKTRVVALRGIRAAFIEALKVEGTETLPDEEAHTILRRLAKQRRESIEAFEQGGREDLVGQEKRELEVIEAYLPALADEETTRAWVRLAIERTGASAPSDMGKVMGALMSAHPGQVDGKLANKLVRELLSP